MDLTGADEDAVAVFAFKVALALHGTIVLAFGVVQLDADPHTGGERGLTDEEDLTMAEVGHFDARVQLKRLRRRAWRPGRLHDR